MSPIWFRPKITRGDMSGDVEAYETVRVSGDGVQRIPPRVGSKEWADAFTAHLDVCAQCESQPFNLCPEGNRLLEGR